MSLIRCGNKILNVVKSDKSYFVIWDNKNIFSTEKNIKSMWYGEYIRIPWEIILKQYCKVSLIVKSLIMHQLKHIKTNARIDSKLTIGTKKKIQQNIQVYNFIYEYINIKNMSRKYKKQ